MSELLKTIKKEHVAELTKPSLETARSTRALNTKWSKTWIRSQKHHGDRNKLARHSSNWRFGDTAFYKMFVARGGWKMILAGRRNDTEYEAAVKQMCSA